ncbi:MAG: hypothetical protein R2855_08575 [Thermomicrobiales bacterium]
MYHRATAVALMLALLSGFALAQLWSLDPVRLRSIQSVPSSQVEATTLAFYQGMNDYLDSGSDDALRKMLHPAFVSHQSGGLATGNEKSLFQQLDAIKQHFPGLRIEPRITPISGTAASVTLDWNHAARTEFAGIVVEPHELIGRLDLLRIERGLIVERWSSAVLAGQLDTFPALSLTLPVALDTLAARVRQIPLLGDHEPTASRFGHLLLIDLSGDAFLEVTDPASIPAMIWKQHRGRVADPAPVEAGAVVALGQMDAVFVPAGATFRMWDAGDQNAALIALEFGPSISGETRPKGSLLADLHTTLWSGIELKKTGDRLTLSFGRAQLLPESTIANPEVGGIELAWVASGEIDITRSWGEVRMRAASGLRSQLIDNHGVLRADDTSAAGPGANVSYQADETLASTVWIFSLVATPDPPDTDAEGTPAAPAALPTPPPPRNIS